MIRKCTTLLFISTTLASCFTLTLNDPSGKNKKLPDGPRKALLPVAVTADIVTSPVQVLAAGTYVGTSMAKSSIQKKSMQTSSKISPSAHPKQETQSDYTPHSD